jgi:hypothetical protein
MENKKYLGDLSTQMSEEVRDEQIQDLIDGKVELDERTPMSEDNPGSIFSKISFRWRDSDKMIIQQIRAASELIFNEQYKDVVQILEDLYFQMRIPEQTGDGIVKKDDEGRIIWARDERGFIIETTEQLTGQDLEKALLDLSQLEVVVAEQTNDLLGEAVFAKNIAKDVADDGWVGIIEGTIDDRRAKVNRDSRVDRYHAFYRWVLYSTSDTFLREIQSLIRRLEKILDRRVWGQRG